jgi:hypothetical protein
LIVLRLFFAQLTVAGLVGEGIEIGKRSLQQEAVAGREGDVLQVGALDDLAVADGEHVQTKLAAEVKAGEGAPGKGGV